MVGRGMGSLFCILLGVGPRVPLPGVSHLTWARPRAKQRRLYTPPAPGLQSRRKAEQADPDPAPWRAASPIRARGGLNATTKWRPCTSRAFPCARLPANWGCTGARYASSCGPGGVPERAKRRSVKRTDPFVAYLRQRWEEGCHRAAQRFRELAEQGFDGSYHMVRRQVATWRHGAQAGGSGDEPSVPHRPSTERPSANRVAWMVLESPEDRSLEDQTFLDASWQRCPELKTGADLAQKFCQLVRDRRADALEDWTGRTRVVGAPRELGVFADGLKQDYAAVKAALRLEWSNGQVEGHINRLKLIKRQMYAGHGSRSLPVSGSRTCFVSPPRTARTRPHRPATSPSGRHDGPSSAREGDSLASTRSGCPCRSIRHVAPLS